MAGTKLTAIEDAIDKTRGQALRQDWIGAKEVIEYLIKRVRSAEQAAVLASAGLNAEKGKEAVKQHFIEFGAE
jgi:hypothetical protein